MPAIVAIPQVVEELLLQFGDLFPNEPARVHFAEYLTGLIVALFTYTPDLVALSLTSGPVAGGQMFGIDGFGLVTSMSVTFKGVPATVISCNETNTTCIVMTGASTTPGTGDVVVTVGDQSDTLPNAYTYV